ncbi:MAG UNVERIFIED_CONTAM: penicillin-binding protein 2 [Rickettsiaceae bacterium]|jgi:penicillin-binding protein 2
MKISSELLRNYLVTRRSFLLLAGKLSMLSLLGLRMLYLQIIDGSKYRTLSDKNRIYVLMMPPLRGKIKDINDKVLADNNNAFNLMLNKSENPDYSEVIEKLSEILGIKSDTKDDIYKIANKIHKKIPGILISNLSWRDVSVIEENIEILKGLYVEIGQYRTYIYPAIFSHPIGYIAQMSTQDKNLFGINNVIDLSVGKNGIERFYENTLRGEFGVKEAEVNAHGTIVREISSKPSIPGQDIKINIDFDLQKLAMDLLPKQGGSAIIMDVNDGRILTLASSPGFDSNQFTQGLSNNYWNKIKEDKSKPLINKTLQTNYPPGSIFKMAVVLAALEYGMDPEVKINCTGGSVLGDSHFRCWYRPGHGSLTLKEGIKHSCNPYMYHIAKTIGAEKILAIAKKFGFGEETGIDLYSESVGLLPSPSWKKNRFGQEWRLGDALNTSIGQGFVLATPLQMARFCSAIANNGKLITPRLCGVGEVVDIDIDKNHLQFIRNAMNEVMNEPGGTAYYHRITEPGWEIAGKTGTAQVKSKIGDIDMSGSSIPRESRNHALFTCFGPVNNPRFSTSVVVDHGGGSRVAAPIARDLMRALFKKYLL